MNIAIVLCPFANVEYPSYEMAILSAILTENSHKIVKIDLNKEIYLSSKRPYLWGNNRQFLKANQKFNSLDLVNSRLVKSKIRKLVELKTKIVIFHVQSSAQLVSLELARIIKEKDKSIITIFYGPIGEHIFEETDYKSKYSMVDFVVADNYEETIPELIDNLTNDKNMLLCKGIWYKKNGRIYTGYREDRNDLNRLPFPDYSGILNLYKDGHGTVLPIISSKGCVQKCVFCSNSVAQCICRNMKARRIFNEIINGYEKYKANKFAFFDNAINCDMKELENLCDLLIRHKLNTIALCQNKLNKPAVPVYWKANARIIPEMTTVFLKKMKRAGCVLLTYGVESGSQRIINKMNKGFKIDTAKKVLKATFESGIHCQVAILIGFPGETEEDFNKTLEFVRDVKPYVNSILVDRPFFVLEKNTYIYDHADQYGIYDKDKALYWESNKGKNYYKVRLGRYNRLCKLLSVLKYNDIQKGCYGKN